MKRTRPTHPLRTMNKRYFLRFGYAAAAALFLFCSCGAKGGSESETTYADGVQYEYSDGGHSERVSARNVWKNGAVAERSVYDYWENGKVKAITNYSGDTETDSWHYSYTEAGTLSAMVRIYTKDGAECRDTYTYNDAGKIALVSYTEGGTEVGGIRYTYNDDGAELRQEQYDKNGSVIAYTEYSFENGLASGAESYQYDSLTSYWKYSYADDGKLSEVRFYNYKDELTSRTEYTYDAEGRKDRVCEYGADGSLAGYTQSLYDDDGENYRDIYYEDGKPVYSTDYTKDGAVIYSEY